MASKTTKYAARALAAGGLALASVTWATARTLEDQGAALCAAGLSFLIFAPTLPQDWRALFYAAGAALLLAGIGLFLVALNSDERAALGSGIHDGRSAPAASSPQTNPARLLPAARVEVIEWGVYLDGVPGALSVSEAVDILAQSLPRNALVEVDMTSGIVDVWPELQAELQDFGFQAYKTIRKPEDR